MRIVSLIMAVVFAGFVSVQFNDVDAWVWIAVYGICAVVSMVAALRAVPRFLTLTLAVIGTIWAVWLIPEANGTWLRGEVEREIGGLLICVVWNLILYRWTASRS